MKKSIYYFVFFSIVSLPFFLNGQNSNQPKVTTHTYLFKNATIIQEAGKELKASDILIKNGLITNVGKSINAPYDAKIIDADSLYIYPALIDPDTHVGFKTPNKDLPKFKATDTPTFEQSGITPQVTVRNNFSAKPLSKKREIGIGFVQVLPRGKMLPGQGSIVTTGDNTFADNVISENNVTYAKFRNAGRYYPSTTMAVMEIYRDLFANVENAKKYEAQYSRNPNGLTKIKTEEEYKALYNAVDGKQQLLFKATQPKEILRVLKLQKELGFKTIISGIKLGSPVINKIKASNNPVFLSLDLPKEYKAEQDSLLNQKLVERKVAAYNTTIGQAKAFKDAGINFGFIIGPLKSKELNENIRRIIDSGLSEKDALAALTINNAKILGIDNVAGSLDKGKIANLFVTDKPFFDKKSNIRYTFIDGKLTKMKIKKSGKAAYDFSGKYRFKVDIPGEETKGYMTITKKGEEFEVSIVTDQEPNESIKADDVIVDGNNMTFSLTTNDGSKYDIELDIKDKAFKGTVSVGVFGSFSMTGKLVNNPE